MSLAAGTRLGPYEILAPIGAGGMGEVYRAKDTKLKRDIALKVLPVGFNADPDRMGRFQREAEVLASLDHPNIGPIYGMVESDDVQALALALIEGPTLADRIAAGPVPQDEAFAIARQIIEALEYAHERGIIHRDLKPANVKVTPEGSVKVLDFGLAKVLDEEAAPGTGVDSPTLTLGHTRPGVILGTAAYMSPEQAIGKNADRRSDIFSFGVVLFEMLTGQRAFGGDKAGETLVSVAKDDPDWSKLPAGLPGAVQKLLRRCLIKDRKKRLQAIGEARIILEEVQTGAVDESSSTLTPARAQSRFGLIASIAAAALLLALGATSRALFHATRPAEPKPLVRLDVDLGPDAVAGANSTVKISPDGTRIVYPVRGPDGKQQLATRLLDQTNPVLLPGTGNAADPFFSPDGQWIGFFADGKLKKISTLGGAPVTLCDAPSPAGASWGDDGNIVAALENQGALSRVSAAGGMPQPLSRLESAEQTHRWPQVLPGNGTALYTSSLNIVTYADSTVQALSLRTGQRKTLLTSAYFGRYLPTNGSTGHVIYIHDGTLFAVPFDPEPLELRGTPAPLLEDAAAVVTSGAGQLDFSRTGAFVYRTGRVSDQTRWPVNWLDSSGRMEPLVSKPDGYVTPSFSPDGRLLLLGLGGGSGREFHIYDWQRETTSRLVLGSTQGNFYPTWSPDGKHLAFRSPTPSGSAIQWMRADGSDEPQHLFDSKSLARPHSFSPDGRRLAYMDTDFKTGSDLWTLPLDLGDPDHPKPGKPEPFLRTQFNEFDPLFSPDGRWIAYHSDESGRFEAYVRPFPGPGDKWQVSTGGGMFPVWSRDGRQIFFETLDNRIMVADYMAKADSFASGKPRLWSETRIRDLGNFIANYDVAPDGKRLVVFPFPEAKEEEKGSVHVTFLLNFFDELRRKVPLSTK